MTGIVPLYAMQIIFTHLIHRIKGYISALAAYSMFIVYIFYIQSVYPVHDIQSSGGAGYTYRFLFNAFQYAAVE